jgi:hypothetical protein
MVDPLFSLLLQRFGDDAHGPEVAGPCAAWWAAVREVRQLRQMCAHPERWRSYQLAHELNSGIFGDLEHFAELFLAVSGDDRLVADATWFMDSGRKVLVVGPDLWWLLMISRCLGLIPLAVLEKLRRLKIRTFGASVAASTLELLASLGAEDISCLDAGLIDPTNIPRLPMADVFSIGQPKAQALVERLSRRNPYGRFQAGVGRAVPTVQAAWAAGQYQHVADVPTNNLDTAWMRTNTIEQPWYLIDDGTVQPKVKIARSSSVGDVFVQGPNYHIADMIGFVEVTGLKLSGK